jgi:ribosome-associated toxin RatA of RatAB toxin-antitoxin module
VRKEAWRSAVREARVPRHPRIIADGGPSPHAAPTLATNQAAMTSRPPCPWALRLLGVFALAAVAHAASARDPLPSVTVRQQGESFVVEASLAAPVPVAVAWDVVTDVDAMTAFVPALDESRILARNGERWQILQRGAIRMGPIAFAYTTVRDVTLVPRTSIRQVQVRGTMPRLETLTTLSPEAGATRLDYRIEVNPATPFPDFVTRFLLRREVEAQLDAIVREMVRRHADGRAPSRQGGSVTPAPPLGDAVAAQAKALRRVVPRTTAAPTDVAWARQG